MKQQSPVDFLVERLNQSEPFYSGISLLLKKNIDSIIDEARLYESKQQLDLLISFQLHLKDRELIDDFEHDFEDEAKIFLYNNQHI